MWGETHDFTSRCSYCKHFNPPTPCGVRLRTYSPLTTEPNFNPPTPCGVRLIPKMWKTIAHNHFNPPTPCGVRPSAIDTIVSQLEFQSTHPVWGETRVGSQADAAQKFQSTHPVWGETAKNIHSHMFSVSIISCS